MAVKLSKFTCNLLIYVCLFSLYAVSVPSLTVFI